VDNENKKRLVNENNFDFRPIATHKAKTNTAMMGMRSERELKIASEVVSPKVLAYVSLANHALASPMDTEKAAIKDLVLVDSAVKNLI
jgi:hypothetical protein